MSQTTLTGLGSGAAARLFGEGTVGNRRMRGRERREQTGQEQLLDDPAPEWMVVGDRLIFVVGFTEGGAPYGVYEDEFDEEGCRVTREVLGLGPFLESLERRLDELPAEQLRRVLLEHGARLPSAERAGFLQVFDTPRTGHDDPNLLDDVESFVADIAKGAYAEGYGFDSDYGEYRTFGDESWTVEMDDLLDRAGAAFLAGDATLARDAYGVLLEALGHDDAESGFPGAGTPEELISSDIGEAKARYLRSVWESEPLATRARALVEAADSLGYLGGDPSLATLGATRREPLPDLDPVLPDLIAALREIHPDGLRFGAQTRRLLAEATERHCGVDGLADLARTPGPRRAEAYRDWVDGLARTGRGADAELAAREALHQLDPHGSVQAELADRLAALAIARDDGAALLEARRGAWRADPTLQRLLRLVDVATALNHRDEVLALEAGRAGEGPLAQRSGLAASLLLLAGQVDEASSLMAAAVDRLGWEHRAHPGPVVVPFLLVGGSGATGDQRWPDLLLCDLLEQVNSIEWLRGPDADLDAFHAALPAGSFPSSPGDDLLLSPLLIDLLSRPAVESEQRKWLEDGCTARSARNSVRRSPGPRCCEGDGGEPGSSLAHAADHRASHSTVGSP